MATNATRVVSSSKNDRVNLLFANFVEAAVNNALNEDSPERVAKEKRRQHPFPELSTLAASQDQTHKYFTSPYNAASEDPTQVPVWLPQVCISQLMQPLDSAQLPPVLNCSCSA
jgi:hypothetical protein